MELGEILFDADAIAARVAEMAAEIDRDYEGREITFVSILRGSFMFTADLIRRVETPCTVDFLAVRSFEGTASTGQVKLVKDLDDSIESRHVIILEDIVDTGLTLKYLRDLLESRRPATLRIATLLDRTDRRECEVEVDYVGFPIREAYVVGYGLDLNQKMRNRPWVQALRGVKR